VREIILKRSKGGNTRDSYFNDLHHMRILFFIDNLNAGGKERRCVELLKGLNNLPDIDFEVVVMDKNIHAASVLGGKIGCNVKIFNFPCYLRSKCRGIETGNPRDAGLAGKNVVPRVRNRIADGRDHAQSGNDYPALGQDGSVKKCA